VAAPPFEEPPLDCPRLPEARGVPQRASGQISRLGQCAGPLVRRIDAGLLIVGLAPGMKGANRTGRPFTGDYAGDLFVRTLLKFGFARGIYRADPNDGLQLVDCRIANAVRCLPPENKPTPVEFTQCGRSCRPSSR